MTILFEIGIAVLALVLLLGVATKGRFFRSISNRVRDHAEQANEALRDPVADGRIAIQDAEAEVTKLKADRRELLVEITTAQSELQELREEETKWDELAKRAGDAGKADDVRLALTKKAAVTTEIADVEAELKEYNTLKDEMTSAIDNRVAEIAEAKSSSKRMIKSIRLDKFRQKAAADKLGGENGTSNSLKQLRDDAKKARNMAIAMETEARTDEPTTSLEKRYAIDTGRVSDDEVAKYLKTA